MALILMCGLPASGKSTIANKLRDSLCANGRTVRIVQDGDDALKNLSPPTAVNGDSAQNVLGAEQKGNMGRKQLYKDSTSEKFTRAQLRANAERALTSSRDITVVIDSLNYIKGFRYELYCVAKTCDASYAVVWATAPVDDCVNRDRDRDGNGADSYGAELVTALARRFEPPEGRNRWDSPLFTIDVQKPDWNSQLPAICATLDSKLQATFATRQHVAPLVDTLGELDRVTRAAEAELISQLQRGAAVGANISVPNASVLVRLQRKPRVAELRNMRRAYLNYSRMHPPRADASATDKLADEYVHYINEQLRIRK